MKEDKKDVKVSARHLLDSYNLDQRKIADLQRREQGLRQILTEMTVAAESLKGIKKAPKDENVLVGLGAGIYAEAKISNVKSVKNSLAGNVLVDAEIDKALSGLEEDMKKARNDITRIRNEAQVTAKNLENIASILREGQRAMQQPENETPAVS